MFLLQYFRLSQLFAMVWSIVMSVYYLITSALIANLYTRYCNDKEDKGSECDEDDEKFIAFPVFGFFIMVTWVSDVNIEYTVCLLNIQVHIIHS